MKRFIFIRHHLGNNDAMEYLNVRLLEDKRLIKEIDFDLVSKVTSIPNADIFKRTYY